MYIHVKNTSLSMEDLAYLPSFGPFSVAFIRGMVRMAVVTDIKCK